MNRSPHLTVVLLFLLGIASGCAPGGDGSRVVGQLESDRVEVAAEVAEPILQRLVREGQPVSAGTTLMQQDTARIEASIAEAKAALAGSRARQDELIRGPRREQIVSAQASVAGAERDLEFRKAQFERASELLDRKLSSEEVRDEAKAALDAATSNVDVQRARLAELLSGTTIEELRQAEQNVLQFEARLSALQIDLERHTIRAPVDGLVDSFLFEPGERPVPMQAAVVMLTGTQPYARVYVSETVRALVRPGTPATVFVDGIEKPFEGRVRWIASDAAFTPYFALTEHDRGRLSYFAKVDIQASGDRLPDGVPVEVELDISTTEAP
jgi:HlyD family secretion protein